MTTVICTITNKKYEPGCISLLNSLLDNNFHGQILIGLIDAQSDFEKHIEIATRRLDRINVKFIRLNRKDNPNYHKPFLLNKCFEESDVQYAYYFDADICCRQPWEDFERWIECGIAVCSDVNFLWMPCSHPRRAGWKKIINQLKITPTQFEGYANGGLVGLARKNRDFLKLWQDIHEYSESKQYRDDLDAFSSRALDKYDQDFLNIALMCTTLPVSLVGPEGMSLAGGVGFTTHAIGKHKPWINGSISKLIVKGQAPSLHDQSFFKYGNHPISSTIKIKYLMKKAEYYGAKMLGRVIGR